METRQILAFNVVRLRQVKHLSQEALAWEAGVSRSYMAKIETAKTSTSLDIIDKLALVLEAEPYQLLMPPAGRRKR
jgi:transcriptional regulator with XRE-family HTH domain